MRTIDLLGGNVTSEIQALTAALDRTLTEATGARSPAVVAAARLITTEARRLVGQVTEDWESAPAGAPPFAHKRWLQKSIRHGVVNGVRRAGTNYFVGRLLEFGTDGEERGPRNPHPWLRPAIEGTIGQMPDAMADAVSISIAKAPI